MSNQLGELIQRWYVIYSREGGVISIHSFLISQATKALLEQFRCAIDLSVFRIVVIEAFPVETTGWDII
jgi:hypothetical protein